MVRILWPLLLTAVACHPRSPPPHRLSAHAATAELLQPLDSAPVIREATVVAFWLPATDTLQGEGADQLEDFHAYTALVAPGLAADSIGFVATTADSVIVVLEGGPTRRIMLAGLDFPFGYVLVEPGFPESILTGVSSDEELLDQVDWYFGLDDGSEAGEAPQLVRRPAQRRSTSATLLTSSAGEKGLWRNAVSGRRVPCWRMASSVYPETYRMRRAGLRSRSRSESSWPLMPGMTMSVTTRSTAPSHCAAIVSASWPSVASRTR